MTSFSRRQLYSVLISAFFWAVIVTAFVFIPLKTAVEEPVYKEIRIQLPPMEEKQPAPEPVKEPEPEPVIEEVVAVVSEPAPANPAAKKAEQAPSTPIAAEPAPAPAAAKKAETAPSTPKALTQATSSEVATVKQTLVKSIDQLMAEQAASKGSKKSADEVDWDAMFGESSTAASSVSTGEKTFVQQQGSSTSGSAATSASDTGTSAAATSGKAKDSSVSAGTADALSSIGDAAGSAVTGGSSRGTAGGVSGGTGTSGLSGSSDGSGLEWGNGAGRKLVNPSKPGITFTDEQKALITASVRDIRISFKVRADGTVLRESIIIDKIASLPAAISQTIERQISEWQFEKGTSDGQAVFVYSIIKE